MNQLLFEVSAGLAFGQGLLSFASPCVLPLIPAYLGYLAGTSLPLAGEAPGARRRLLVNACFYVLGFSMVFVAMGATATVLGAFLQRYAALLRQISGVVLLLLALALLFSPAFLQRERRLILRQRPAGPGQSLLFGMVFAFGWTPCIGPVLGAVLMMAASSTVMWQGVGLLLLYSLGLGLPFLLLAGFLQSLQKPLRALNKYARPIRLISALLLLGMGVLMLTDSFSRLAAL